MNPLNIITLLQMALSLLANPQVQSNPQMLSQANTLVNQVIILAEDEVAKNVELVNQNNQELNNQALGSVSTDQIQQSQSQPTPNWLSTGKYEISMESIIKDKAEFNINSPYIMDRISTDKNFNFFVSARLINYQHTEVKEPQCNCNDRGFPVSNESVTATYGDQIVSSITDENGRVFFELHALGNIGKNAINYSSQYASYSDFITEEN